MPAEKSLAIVLRLHDFSESSHVLTMFTREWGKVQALAKGARRPKGPFDAALDLLAVCRVVFLRKSSEALDLLTEAKLERRFRGRGRDLTSVYAGYYVAELLNDLTQDYDPHPQLFDAARQTLSALGDSGSIGALVLRFELTTLRILGHLPSLAVCAECGRTVPESRRMAFGIAAGGVLCPACRVGKPHVVSVNRAAMNTLATFADSDCPVAADATVARDTAGELRAVLNRYIWHVLGHQPRLHTFLADALSHI